MLKELLPKFQEESKANFLKFGSLVPVCITNCNGKLAVHLMNWKTPEDKDAFSSQIIDWISKNQITEYVIIAEAYAADMSSHEIYQEWMQKHGSLANYPDRKEIITITYASFEEEIYCTTTINRGIVITFDEWNVHKNKTKFNNTDFSSRFGSLFIRSKSNSN